MLETYKTIYKSGQGEIIEKKSRFIADVRLVESEEEATAFIEETKKKYWDARHHCSAYVIGERREITRCSDDGEPQGTAGRPMLDVLLGENLYNTAVVVTRYFGGTLLGTGGLVRAYSKAVQEGLADSVIIEKHYGVVLQVDIDYTGLGKIQHLLGEEKIPVVASEYGEDVKLDALISVTEKERLVKAIIEVTNGRAKMQEKEELYYAMVDGEPILF